MVNIVIPEDLHKIIADIVANKDKEERDLDEDMLERLYIEILPEEYEYYPEDNRKKKNPIVIEM